MPSTSVSGDILALLGDDIVGEESYGAPLHTDIVSRWTSILQKGLSEENKKIILEKYKPPVNFQLLCPPKINPGVQNVLSVSVARRDARLTSLQLEIDASLDAIGLVISSMLNEGERERREQIERLSDAAKLLCNVHFTETKCRRELILLDLNKDLKSTLSEAPFDEWLFGENLDSRVETAKNLEKFGQVLKPNMKQKEIRKTTMPKTNVRSLNFGGPSRLAQGGRQGGQTSHHVERPRHHSRNLRPSYEVRTRKGNSRYQRRSKHTKQ